eukprot:NODE_174_length_15906_cov_0.510533.p6 type:complete len:279 gc:universal NODE_174_length_15906_cov_0.510533:7792-6956(-)
MNFISVISNINLAYNTLIKNQISSLDGFKHAKKLFYLNFTAYCESCKSFLIDFVDNDLNLLAKYDTLLIEFNREDPEMRLSSEFKHNWHSKFNHIFLEMWDALDVFKNDNILKVEQLYSVEWKELLFNKLNSLYFDYLNSSFVHFSSINLLFSELKNAQNGILVGQMNFEAFNSILTIDKVHEKLNEHLNSLKPKKVDRKKSASQDELNRFIKFQEDYFSNVFNEHKQSTQGVVDFITRQTEIIMVHIDLRYKEQTKFVDDLCEMTKYCIEAEIDISK